ncbi:MAG: asparagine synthase (glutamine-hydrolyzing) [Acidobacteria bacterium]|nr:asparagine synthase (glutamine-hydrolyzing) [Acidobacteriota bacterium]MBV9925450.1 asparagine synthase (glutamine-hydrolyzing) [Acidobacteriota bacterium]
MCGICGVWEYGSAEGRVEAPLVESMRDRMPHRGPDDAGVELFDEGRLGLGFRRLSIIDLSPAGHQPMRGCEGEGVWLVFNGEIYNHAKLREGLEQRGHVYRSRTDSETILHLYEERGLDFVKELEGDYAIAVWDEARDRLVLARDRVGVKPLYYHAGGGRLVFASEIKAILAHTEVSAELDEESLVHYLSFLTTPAPRTLFRGVHKLPAGHMLVCERSGELKSIRYWDALPPAAQTNGAKPTREEEYREEILRLLRESIKKRMMSDVPFGVFLSGGVDSSANVALMAEQMSRPVETFTVGHKEHEELNELEQARDISRRFGTNHHEVLVGERELLDFLPGLVFHQDEPLADPVCVPLYYVSKLARESGTIVVQVGEGSDELFSGYDKYVKYLRLYERFWRRAEQLPAFARRAAGRIAQPLVDAATGKAEAAELARRFGAGESLFWGAAVVFDETLKARLLSSEARARFDGLSSYEVVREDLERVGRERPASDFLARMTYLELKLRLPELLLMRVDKMTMATSVEARVPFLDHHLVEYAMGVPRALKVEGRSGKHVLKRALEEVLPRDVLYRRKRGFGAPVEGWFRGPSASELESRVMNSTLRRRGLLDYRFVARLFAEHRRGARDWGFHLWALLNLSLWYERWIDSSGH